VAEFIGAMQAIEQELRLPRTPLELAAEERTVRPQPTAGEDRTQVRAPQVIQPTSTLPLAGGPITSFAPSSEEVSALETRRAAAKVTPVRGFDADAEGRTVLRASAVQPTADVEQQPAKGPRRGLAIGLAAVVLVAIAAGGWVLATTPRSAGPAPTPTVSESPPDVGELVAPPGIPTIRCDNGAKSVTCTWEYANPLATDHFSWRVKGTNDVHETRTAKAEIQTRNKVCIEVKVFRQDTSYTPANWTPGGTCG
jgi:hypothetical protein